MQPPRQPFHLLAKPSGAQCNLDCRYCFYLEKQSLYAERRPRMDARTQESYIRQLLHAHPAGEVTVAWQGGEPTLLGLDFYERAMALVERHRRPGQTVTHTLQTNGLLIDEDWARFLRRHRVLVGLSLDGPQPLHDTYRVTRGGQGSFAAVLRAWERLRRHEVEVNLLCCVHAANGDQGLAVYRFFRDELGASHLQFIPVVDRLAAQVVAMPGRAAAPPTSPPPQLAAHSVQPAQWGRFLIAVFDEWLRRDVGRVFVQTFDATLANRLGMPSLCLFSPSCGRALALEHNGDLYACDHFVDPAHRLGNIAHEGLAELVASERQRRFGDAKWRTLPRQCRDCEVLDACFGECPKNRFATTPDGEPGLNVLCEGYRAFFRHVEQPMAAMAGLLRAGRDAHEIMTEPAA
jgi:uncharacterized protein